MISLQNLFVFDELLSNTNSGVMQKTLYINRTPFHLTRVILAFILLTAGTVFSIMAFLQITDAESWFNLHKKAPWIIFIEGLPILFIGFLFYTTSKKHQEEIAVKQTQEKTKLINRTALVLEKIKSDTYDPEKDTIDIELLDSSLRDFYLKIRQDAENERNRNWTNEGMAMFREIMGSHATIKEMCDDLIAKLVKYIDANQAGIFVLNEGDDQLELTSCYAFDRKKFLTKVIRPGEGLIGQCYLEKQSIILKSVPGDYINITSGLGAANPKFLMIVPLNLKEKTVGVMELASFQEFRQHTIEFLERLAEALAHSISSIHTNEQTSKLLQMSLEREKEMKDQEELTRQNMEELHVMQEDMRKVNIEMEEIFRAINTLSATVELDQQGRVLKLNDKFSDTLGFTLEQMHGKPFKTLLSRGTEENQLFDILWKNVSEGKPQEKVFSFTSDRNEARWIRTGFYPLRGANDEVTRVLCFLTDISEVKAKEMEMDKVNKEMEATRRMLIKILNEIPLKVFLKQYNGKFFVVNDAVSRFHGFETPEGLIGKSDFDFYDHKDASEWLEAEHKIIASGKTSYIHEDGGKILSTVKMPFYIDPLQETGLLGFQADVTELEMCKKKVEEISKK